MPQQLWLIFAGVHLVAASTPATFTICTSRLASSQLGGPLGTPSCPKAPTTSQARLGEWAEEESRPLGTRACAHTHKRHTQARTQRPKASLRACSSGEPVSLSPCVPSEFHDRPS